MSLFIQNSAGLVGTGGVSALDAGVDIGTIANGDTNVGTAAVAGRPELEQVTYNPQQDFGIPATRLFNLVNTNFGVNPQNIDIIVVAGGAGFALNNGLLLTQVGGTSLPPGLIIGGVNLNPSTSIVVLYDTTQSGGQGFCAKPQDSANLTLQTANSVILYHELSHAFRQATNAVLNGNEPDCNTASAEESAAEVDENDMRDQLVVAGGGAPGPGTRRDTGNHCGANCGGSTINCCIVASIASGSPYSQEVDALRRVRDEFLRRSSVGLDFFDRLHDDYYGFSPQVCRLMAEAPGMRDRIGDYFVRPLVLCLDMVHAYSLGTTGAALGARFAAGIESSPVLRSLSSEQAVEALNLIRGRAGKTLPERSLAELIESRARPSEYVRWAVMEPLEFYVEAVMGRLEGRSLEATGAWLGSAIDAWAARLPVTEVWMRLSNRGFREELQFLGTALLRTPEARARFAARLPEGVCYGEVRKRILAETGFGKEFQP